MPNGQLAEIDLRLKTPTGEPWAENIRKVAQENATKQIDAPVTLTELGSRGLSNVDADMMTSLAVASAGRSDAVQSSSRAENPQSSIPSSCATSKRMPHTRTLSMA